MAYASAKSNGYPLTKLPVLSAVGCVIFPPPDRDVLLGMVDLGRVDEEAIDEMMTFNIPDVEHISIDSFYQTALRIHAGKHARRTIANLRTDPIGRSQLHAAAARHYMDFAVDPGDVLYSEWLADRGIDIENLDYSGLNILVDTLFKTATGHGNASNITTREIHKALCELMSSLTTYDVQIISSVNDGEIYEVEVGNTGLLDIVIDQDVHIAHEDPDGNDSTVTLSTSIVAELPNPEVGLTMATDMGIHIKHDFAPVVGSLSVVSEIPYQIYDAPMFKSYPMVESITAIAPVEDDGSSPQPTEEMTLTELFKTANRFSGGYSTVAFASPNAIDSHVLYNGDPTDTLRIFLRPLLNNPAAADWVLFDRPVALGEALTQISFILDRSLAPIEQWGIYGMESFTYMRSLLQNLFSGLDRTFVVKQYPITSHDLLDHIARRCGHRIDNYDILYATYPSPGTYVLRASTVSRRWVGEIEVTLV
jgi:hypothetical protein